MLQVMRGANLGIAFALEIAMLAAFCVAGWLATEIVWLKFVLALALPGLAILVWAVWAAPRSNRRLKGAPLVAFKMVIFAFAAAALWAAGLGWWGAAFAIIAIAHLGGAAVLGQI